MKRLLIAVVLLAGVGLAQSNPVFFNTNYTASLGTVATPAFSPDGGSVSSGATVTITDATSGSAISYCTATGADCTPGTSYSAPVAITVTNTHLCASATKASYTTSATHCATFTVTVSSTATYVSGANHLASGTSSAVTYSCTAGNALIVGVWTDGSGVTSVGVTGNETFTQRAAATVPISGTNRVWAYTATCAGGADTITATANVSNDIIVSVAEYTGKTTFDVAASGQPDGAGAYSVAATGAASGELAVCIVGTNNNAITQSWGTARTAPSNGNYLQFFDILSTPAAATTCTGNQVGPSGGDVLVMMK